MMTNYKPCSYYSLFSGIEAATVAFEPLGWKPLCFSEIDAFPNAVLAHHYPDVPNLGDITQIKWKQVIKKYGKPNVIIGGSPCQSFSIAGNRTGLNGASGLMWEYVRAVREVKPDWIIWENVPGALTSTGGADFKCLLENLDKLRYGLAWRILDAQFFGVAQRRRRVFLVGHLGDVRGATEVLFEPHMLHGNLGASKAKRKELAAAAQRSSRKCVQIVGNVINRTERSGGNGNGLCDADSEGGYTLTATDRHAVIEEPLCFDTTQVTSAKNGNNPKRGDACHTLSANADPPTIIMREREGCAGGGKGALIQDNVSATLATTNDQVLCVMGITSNAAITNDHASTLLSYQGGGTIRGNS